MARYKIVFQGTKKEVIEKAAIVQQVLDAIDQNMAGYPSRLIPLEWCPRCGTPIHHSGLKKPRKCDICGCELELD
jgi:hypothetical protein